jgi:AcrR family transcriptional regulator
VALHDERPRPGLRERKKASTRAAIQRHALQLIREQGYEATTISQIADAADISESTFFRYFPTKEDLVRWDEYDPLIIAAVRAQPAGAGPIAALRGAFRDVLSPLSPEERAELRQRLALMLEIPPLRAMGAEQLSGPLRPLVAALAERAGLRPDDFALRTLVGAVMGVVVVAMLEAVDDPRADLVALIDEALEWLEAGLPL